MIDALVTLLNRREEKTFRDPNAPFYWLSARLWLLVALDRIADEAPDAVARHARMLLAVATDEELPHVLMRDFAAAAVRKLVAADAVALTADEDAALARVNVPSVPPRPSLERGTRGFGHVHYDLVKNRRFVFDTMDTIPYWYGPASRIFAEISPKTFLDAAEEFIVDQWAAGDAERAWDKQARLGRLRNREMSTLNNHGSRPQLERYHTHLEWHAMFCAVGELLRSQAPVQPDETEDDYDTVPGWLRQEGLSSPPHWLADHLAPKPAESADRVPGGGVASG